jgi:N-acetylmuramoyl-L-alanine amidase
MRECFQRGDALHSAKKGIVQGRTLEGFTKAQFFVAGLTVSLVALLTATAQAPLATVNSPSRFAVVLDAAHGGDDAGGSLHNNQVEKTYTLALSVKLRSLLMARGIQVVTTRESDTTVNLDRRAEIANHANAQACLSLHASETGEGVHVFVSSLTPAQPTRFTAWKTAQAASVTRSLALAGVVNSALQHAGMNVTLGRTSLPTVDSMTCPAIAVEVAPGQGSDKKVTELDDSAYQAQVAEALAAALLEWRTEGRQP